MSSNNFFVKFYSAIVSIGTWLQTPLLLVLRLFWGYQFFTTGMGKLQNIKGVASYFQSLGIPFPEMNAYLVGCVETIGGICLILGLAVRFVTLPMITAMIVALFTASREATLAIFKDPQNFTSQSPVSFLVVLLVLFAFGPGCISIDCLLQKIFGKSTSQ